MVRGRESVRLGSLCIVVVLGVGCFDDTTPLTYTKDEARRLGGVDPAGRDICALQDWYGDGVCDAFCVELDEEDCAMCPDPDSPTVHYVSTDPLECARISFVCPPGTEPDRMGDAHEPSSGAEGRSGRQRPRCGRQPARRLR